MNMNTKQKYLTTGLALVLAGNIYAQECISNMCRQSESTLTISQIQAIQTEYKKVIGNPNVYQIDSYAREKFGWAGGPMRGNEVLLSVDLGGQKDLFLTNCDGINPGRLERITETPNKNEESPCFLPNGTITYHVRTQTFDTEFYLLINHNPLNKNPPLYTTKSTWERDHPTILQPPIAKLPPPPFFYNPAPITWPGELAVKGIQKIWKGIGSLF